MPDVDLVSGDQVMRFLLRRSRLCPIGLECVLSAVQVADSWGVERNDLEAWIASQGGSTTEFTILKREV
jgi:hypothetical protein